MSVRSVLHLLLPERARYFPGQRWFNICLRSLHVVGVAGIGGGFLFNLPEDLWRPFWHLALSTGVGLSALYIWSSAIWLFQLKGVVILGKLGLLALAMGSPAWRAELFVAVIILSGVIAHAPGPVRGYTLVSFGRSGGDGH